MGVCDGQWTRYWWTMGRGEGTHEFNNNIYTNYIYSFKDTTSNLYFIPTIRVIQTYEIVGYHGLIPVFFSFISFVYRFDSKPFCRSSKTNNTNVFCSWVIILIKIAKYNQNMHIETLKSMTEVCLRA